VAVGNAHQLEKEKERRILPLMTGAGLTAEPKWDFILTTLPAPYEVPEIDLEMLLVEAIVAIPLAIVISLISCGTKTALKRINVLNLLH
jgi:hypothetical protein